MEQAALLGLIVLVALAVLFLLTVRRLSTLVGRTRTLERYQKHVSHLERRLATTADPFIGQLDEIRRRSGDPRNLAEAMPGAQDALRAIAADARTAKVPHGLGRAASAFAVELERAGPRGTDLAQAWCAQPAARARGRDPDRERDRPGAARRPPDPQRSTGRP